MATTLSLEASLSAKIVGYQAPKSLRLKMNRLIIISGAIHIEKSLMLMEYFPWCLLVSVCFIKKAFLTHMPIMCVLGYNASITIMFISCVNCSCWQKWFKRDVSGSKARDDVYRLLLRLGTWRWKIQTACLIFTRSNVNIDFWLIMFHYYFSWSINLTQREFCLFCVYPLM